MMNCFKYFIETANSPNLNILVLYELYGSLQEALVQEVYLVSIRPVSAFSRKFSIDLRRYLYPLSQ